MAAPGTCTFCGHDEAKHNVNGCLHRPFSDSSEYCNCWGPVGARGNYQNVGYRWVREQERAARQIVPPSSTTIELAPIPAPPAAQTQPDRPNTQPLATLAQAIELIVCNAYEFAPILRGALLEYD